MRCRPATDADADALRDLRRAWREEDAGGPIEDAAFDAAFDEWWAAEAPRRRHWVAAVDGHVVGMASVVVMVRMPQPGRVPSRWGYVHHVYVRPEHRGTGLGGALLDAVIGACRDDGFERLVLHPTERSLPFYEHLGFEPAADLVAMALEAVRAGDPAAVPDAASNRVRQPGPRA